MEQLKTLISILISCVLFQTLTNAKRVVLNKNLTPEEPENSKTFLNLRQSNTKDLIQERMMKYENPNPYYAASKGRKPVGNKTYALGTDTIVFHDTNFHKGFFSTVVAAYANHWTLVTSPEDWWFTIVQRVVSAVDSNSEKQRVREHFVAHQDKKELMVYFDRGLYSSNHSAFLQQMTDQVSLNIKDPNYVSIMRPDFSTTTEVHGIIGNIAIMSSLQEYFEYTGGILCGIPEVEMKGTLADWEKLALKLNKLKDLLTPISEDIGLSSWWQGMENVVDQLVMTYSHGNTSEWWSQIVERREEVEGCGSVEVYWSGWFLEQFLGQDINSVHNGLVSVPLNIEMGDYHEQSALVAGMAGFSLDQDSYSVEAQHVWNLMLEPLSKFRQ